MRDAMLALRGMPKSESPVQELNQAAAAGSKERREKALRYAVDVLAVGSFTDDEIWTFGEVIGQLAEAIEVEARAYLSERLVAIERAPANVVERLAFDDSIRVAGPILRDSGQLSTQ